MKQTTMQTYGGNHFDLLAPRPESVNINDIAHHLAGIARFNGATIGTHAYTVAQHSVLVLHLVDGVCGDPASKDMALAALLHDAHEAYVGDITTPVKAALRAMGAREALCKLVEGIDAALCARFELSKSLLRGQGVKSADLLALAYERRHLMVADPVLWPVPDIPTISTHEPCPTLLDCAWSAAEAEQRFLEAFEQVCRRD